VKEIVREGSTEDANSNDNNEDDSLDKNADTNGHEHNITTAVPILEEHADDSQTDSDPDSHDRLSDDDNVFDDPSDGRDARDKSES
jgi:hypothetical protein